MKFFLSTLFLGLSLVSALPVHAQRNAYAKKASSIVSDYKKQIQQASKEVGALADSADTHISPYIYRLLGPGVYYSSVLKQGFAIDHRFPWQAGEGGETEGMGYRDRLNASVNGALLNAYALNPAMFRYHDSQIASEEIVSPAADVEAKTEDLKSIYDKVDEIKDVAEVVEDVDVDIKIEKPNFWKTSGRFVFQFTQNYFSENWYKGGNNNVTLLSNLVLEANYNDQKRLSWENKLDLRLGFVTATSDSIHRYLTNNDKIDLFSKLGVKAAKAWYYTLSAEAKSQFLPGYRSNDRRAYSKFLSPLDVYVSLGMDFKPALKNGNSLSLQLLPLSYKMRYISDEEEAIHKSYNMADKDFQQDFGSKIEFNSKLSLAKNLIWRCRLYCFTSYEYVEGEMENVFSFQFNKYISTEVNTLWRFDDNRDMKYYDHTLGYFQFKEFFSLGLSYNF